MPADFMQSDFALLFKRDCPLLDVRSPVEFARGAFPASTNIPLLTDAQRTEVGTMYRRSGGEAATRLGHKLVSGDSRSALIERWRNFIEHNPEARLYCFRGGQRSHVVQQWLQEAGVEIPLVPGGYKALRGFLLHVLEEAARLDFLVIAGKTGCGKTHLVTELPCALDIEGAAGHRGSAFGALPDPQPSQIDFENAMAVALLKLEFESLPVLIAEDESRAVGSLAIPHVLFDRMKQAPLALIEESLEVRVETILHDYILANLAAWEEYSPGRGAAILEQSLLESLERIRRRLGDGGFRKTGALMRQAFTVERQESLALHRRWISLLLENYYDPMYEYQLARKLPRVRCRGRREEIARWCRTYMSSSATA
ncbi:MAG: tRNA 2-selenouridine(34) synthase MnmH [Gammaproteobacteria bacterium]|nr:tRNA 2-selenouridine(34) synthase MnmH [Gammaproteobacteria bacterium]MYH84930.1 tRNA 2-selenouridine(34) synthase MnmH [Gammaproteobacteria bacterium]MYK03773.1 tRNA 2-selenouridine(34) synthase MnmH [Gammaproteobacteria bacterium]